jgi:DNA invertase Pin-like site-specific DNA recombinase
MSLIQDKTVRKCAIYCRVSTDEQNPKHQEDYLKNFALQQNIKVYKVYTDIITGRKDTRPELNNMLFDMRNGLFNSILAYKIDRLGRSTKHLLTICEECNNKNVALIFATQNIDTTTAVGKMFFTILGSIAEFESSLISERTKLGQRNAKNIGKRGRDLNPRRKSGYYQRWINESKKMGG